MGTITRARDTDIEDTIMAREMPRLNQDIIILITTRARGMDIEDTMARERPNPNLVTIITITRARDTDTEATITARGMPRLNPNLVTIITTIARDITMDMAIVIMDELIKKFQT